MLATVEQMRVRLREIRSASSGLAGFGIQPIRRPAVLGIGEVGQQSGGSRRPTRHRMRSKSDWLATEQAAAHRSSSGIGRPRGRGRLFGRGDGRRRSANSSIRVVSRRKSVFFMRSRSCSDVTVV